MAAKLRLTEVGGHEQGQPQPSGSAEFLGLSEIARGGPAADENGPYDGFVPAAVGRLGQWGSNRSATEDAARSSRTARVWPVGVKLTGTPEHARTLWMKGR